MVPNRDDVVTDYPSDHVSWIVGRLAGRPADLAQFAAEVDVWLKAQRPDNVDIQGLMDLLEDWMTSLRLQSDPVWQRQMSEPSGRRRARA
jgi:hypothetical protein